MESLEYITNGEELIVKIDGVVQENMTQQELLEKQGEMQEAQLQAQIQQFNQNDNR
jgi:hypothetical protein